MGEESLFVSGKRWVVQAGIAANLHWIQFWVRPRYQKALRDILRTMNTSFHVKCAMKWQDKMVSSGGKPAIDMQKTEECDKSASRKMPSSENLQSTCRKLKNVKNQLAEKCLQVAENLQSTCRKLKNVKNQLAENAFKERKICNRHTENWKCETFVFNCPFSARCTALLSFFASSMEVLKYSQSFSFSVF